MTACTCDGVRCFPGDTCNGCPVPLEGPCNTGEQAYGRLLGTVSNRQPGPARQCMLARARAASVLHVSGSVCTCVAPTYSTLSPCVCCLGVPDSGPLKPPCCCHCVTVSLCHCVVVQILVCCWLQVLISFMPLKVLRRLFPPVVSGVTVILIGTPKKKKKKKKKKKPSMPGPMSTLVPLADCGVSIGCNTTYYCSRGDHSNQWRYNLGCTVLW